MWCEHPALKLEREVVFGFGVNAASQALRATLVFSLGQCQLEKLVATREAASWNQNSSAVKSSHLAKSLWEVPEVLLGGLLRQEVLNPGIGADTQHRRQFYNFITHSYKYG